MKLNIQVKYYSMKSYSKLLEVLLIKQNPFKTSVHVFTLISI